MIETRESTESSSVVAPSAPARRKLLLTVAASALLLVLVVQLALVAHRESITWDEDDHIFAGYMQWKTADYGLNPEHPPMVKMIATLPILTMPLEVPKLQTRYFKEEAFLSGRDFVFKNDANAIVFRTRMAASVFTLALALLVFLAATEMFGRGAGLIALALFDFEPNLLAHGAVVTTDLGLSCSLFATVYAFWRYSRSPSAWRLLLIGLAAGLTLSAKHTGILVFPVLVLLFAAEIISKRREQATWKLILHRVVALIAIAAIAFVTLWAFYGFRYAARPAGLQLNPTMDEMVRQLPRSLDAKLIGTAARWHLLPESYLYGLADVRQVVDSSPSYLFGKVYPHGVRLYFPAAFVIKSTLTFLLLLTFAAFTYRRWGTHRESIVLLFPAALYFSIAVASTINLGLRHILPIHAFLIVWMSGAAWHFARKSRRWTYTVVALLGFHAVSSAQAFPAYLAYSNELWGGPSNTYKYLTDSNVDWAQQVKATHKYLDERGIKDCWFAYFARTVVDTSYYGIPCKPLPTISSLWLGEQMDVPPHISGTVLISHGTLSGYEFGPGLLNPYEQFKSVQPKDVIEYGLFVYEGEFDVPLAAALAQAQRGSEMLAKKQLEQALEQAQRAYELAPASVRVNLLLGDVLTELKREGEARAAYERALHSAKTIEPEFQGWWVPIIENKLSAAQ